MTATAPAPTSSAASAATPRLPTKIAAVSGAGRRAVRHASGDPLSDRATLALIRRTLCPQQRGDQRRNEPVAIEDLLSPLTSRNDVDLQLYAFLAIILREFVQSWYSKITTDETFVAEILHIIAHCTRALEQRLRHLDLESLLLDEIPEVIDRHASAYRAAHRPVSRPPIRSNPREAYHALNPLPQLSPIPREVGSAASAEQEENERCYRQLLVQAVLAILLPTEDLENPCLTALVSQIFSELIIGNVIVNKASQPWLLFEGICILARDLDEKKMRAAQRIVSGSQSPDPRLPPEKRWKWTARGFFLALIQVGIFLFSSIRFLAGAWGMSSSLPPRLNVSTSSDGGAAESDATSDAPSREKQQNLRTTAKVPVLAFKIWSCIGNLGEMGARVPWVSGLMSLLQYGAVHGPGQVAGFDSFVDRFLSHHIRSALAPSQLPPILRSLRGAIFPNNAPGAPSLFPPSSDDELCALRRRAAVALWGLLPKGVTRIYFGGHRSRRDGHDGPERSREAVVDELEGLLQVFGDVYCNKHLVYGVLELILVRLMPELCEKGVTELWGERLG